MEFDLPVNSVSLVILNKTGNLSHLAFGTSIIGKTSEDVTFYVLEFLKADIRRMALSLPFS